VKSLAAEKRLIVIPEFFTLVMPFGGKVFLKPQRVEYVRTKQESVGEGEF
jgi:hypothetical protein